MITVSPYVGDVRPRPGDLVKVVRGGRGGAIRTLAFCLSNRPKFGLKPAETDRDACLYEFIMAGPPNPGAYFRSWVVLDALEASNVWQLEVIVLHVP